MIYQLSSGRGTLSSPLPPTALTSMVPFNTKRLMSTSGGYIPFSITDGYMTDLYLFLHMCWYTGLHTFVSGFILTHTQTPKFWELTIADDENGCTSDSGKEVHWSRNATLDLILVTLCSNQHSRM